MVISLIGMPGSGKSTVGVALARALGYAFQDTDVLVSTRATTSLKEIIRREGAAGLRAAEEACIVNLRNVSDTVIGTGGSAVYSVPAMTHLACLGPIVWLYVPVTVLETRIGDPHERGVLMGAHKDLSSLYEERATLYKKHAAVSIDGTDSPDTVVSNIRKALHV